MYDEKSPHYDKAIFELGIPILGICYGSQLMAYTLGGHVDTAPVSEYGKTEMTTSESKLFENVDKNTVVWMSHTDYIDKIRKVSRLLLILTIVRVRLMKMKKRNCMRYSITRK